MRTAIYPTGSSHRGELFYTHEKADLVAAKFAVAKDKDEMMEIDIVMCKEERTIDRSYINPDQIQYIVEVEVDLDEEDEFLRQQKEGRMSLNSMLGIKMSDQ